MVDVQAWLERTHLHTSKRMHFIEEMRGLIDATHVRACIRQNVCTSLRIVGSGMCVPSRFACIRQNVCTSLRMSSARHVVVCQGACIRQNVCTSLRSSADRQGRRGPFQACIRQNVCTSLRSAYGAPTDGRTSTCIRQNVCTSLRSLRCTLENTQRVLAYVKTYALH